MSDIPGKKDQLDRWNRIWDKILQEIVCRHEEPDDFVKFLVESLGETKTLQVLDLGCGGGRHLVYFESHGLKAYGIDFAQAALSVAKKRLSGQGLDAFLVKCDMRMLPFVDSCFDIVVSTRVIYHQRLEEIRKTVLEIARVLKRRGLILADLLSTRTYSYGKGEKVEENTFLEREGPENGGVRHFSDKQEAESLFENFKILSLKHREREVEGRVRSRWLVTAAARSSSHVSRSSSQDNRP